MLHGLKVLLTSVTSAAAADTLGTISAEIFTAGHFYKSRGICPPLSVEIGFFPSSHVCGITPLSQCLFFRSGFILGAAIAIEDIELQSLWLVYCIGWQWMPWLVWIAWPVTLRCIISCLICFWAHLGWPIWVGPVLAYFRSPSTRLAGPSHFLASVAYFLGWWMHGWREGRIPTIAQT